MEWSKYPIEKLVFFVASVIPGFTALIIFQVAAPGSFDWFFHVYFLGYRTKLAIIAFVAFAIGFTMTTLLRVFLGALGGVLRTLRSPKPAHTLSIAPWRDPRWRAAVKVYLGTQAPPDTVLITNDLFQLKHKALDLQPEPMKSFAIAQLTTERITTELNDSYWSQWYGHFHRIVLEPGDRDFAHVWWGLTTNFGTAGLYLILSSIVVPTVRQWWSLLPAVGWVIALFGQEYGIANRYINQWSTLSEQIKYLLQTQPLEKVRSSTAGSA